MSIHLSTALLPAKIKVMYLLDQTWLPFSNLMLKHIYNVLLICSDYDRFMLEEDGRVEEELYLEYTALGLSNPPKITHTNDEQEALKLLSTLNFDLVITMLDLQTGRVELLAENIKKICPGMPVIALSPSPDHRKAKALKGENCPYIDYLFYWQGNASLFLAMIKLIEDRINIDHDTDEADVQVIILVEDSVRFISSYLPQMYTCLIHQNRISILEALNEWGKTLRMRGRPKIVLARNYNEAWDLFTKYKENVLGVISDVSFPIENGKREMAGLELCRNIKAVDPEIPVLIQSRELKNKDDALALGADFIWKLSSTLLQDLETYFLNHYNFGPFIFINPSTGREIGKAETMKELQSMIKTIPIESFIYHSKKNDFSRWLRAQSLYQLASMIKPINLGDHDDPEDVRKLLYDTIKEYRSDRTRGVIAEFSSAHYDETLHFSRIGKGSMGGKGRGLAFLAMEMHAMGIRKEYPELYLSTPRTVVITTEIFDIFMSENGLQTLYFVDRSDEEILKLFLSKPIPKCLEDSLAQIIQVIKVPISVRSSSLLEDSHFQPFAGVYQTCMIPNQGDDFRRYEELKDAIRTVWASTYFRCAKEYLKNTDHTLEDEKMAVIIQQVTGSAHDNYWYPNISGVARSLNYYPAPGQSQEDGIGMLSFGFGKTVVDEGTSFRFCPAKPKRPNQALTGSESSSQDTFYALNLEKPFRPLEDSDNLEKLPISTASCWPKSMKGIFSSLDMRTGMISERIDKSGVNMLTFNGILKYDTLPLAKIVDQILKMGTRSMAEPVEIEFAVNTEREKPDFSILQIRPISGQVTESDIVIEAEDRKEALIYAEKVMGNGIIEDIRDIITIKKDAFKASEMVEMASELSELNSSMESCYVLIACGRLGSSDRWLGIPCTWSDISKAHVIVETGLKELDVEPSQGTHFFQNMTSLGCIYLTVNPLHGDGDVDFKKLEEMDKVRETKHFLHVRSKKDLIIKVNGRTSKAVIKEENDA